MIKRAINISSVEAKKNEGLCCRLKKIIRGNRQLLPPIPFSWGLP